MEAREYQVFRGGKTKRSRPILLHKNVKGQKEASKKAEKYHDLHPDRYVGVFEVKTIKVIKPTKQRK